VSLHSDVVTYCWTEVDRLAVLSKMPNQYVTPYRVPTDAIDDAADIDADEYVTLSLALSIDPPTIARFFREPYEWIPVPPEVDPGATLGDLFAALHAFDPVRFAHMDVKSAAVSLVASTVKKVLSGSVKPGIPSPASVTPLADLAQLHFDYWGNTDLRAAVFRGTVSTKSWDVLGVANITIPWFGSSPLALPTALLEPIAIPTQQDGASIQYVLALRPAKGVAVAAPPSTGQGDAPILITSLTPPRIELAGWGRQVLAPFVLDEWKTGGSGIDFTITLPRPSVETRIEILRGGAVHYAEVHGLGELLVPGPHTWTWGGFDSAGVYDTKALCANDLAARVTSKDAQGRVTSATTSLGTAPEVIRWLDVRLERATHTATACVHPHFMNPSDVDLASISLNLPSMLGGVLPGLPSLPGGATIPSLPGLPSMPALPSELTGALTVPPMFDLPQEQFATFQQKWVVESIERHWTRAKDMDPSQGYARSVKIDGADWNLTTTCVPRDNDAFPMILAADGTDAFKSIGMSDPLGTFPDRSCNLATFMEGLPIIDIFTSSVTTDVGAHELGHTILRETRGIYYSLTHKGTSTPGQGVYGSEDGAQKALNVAQQVLGGAADTHTSTPLSAELGPHAPPAPLYDEVDVMFYLAQKKADGSVDWAPSKPTTMMPFVDAVEPDALGLLWCARVAFG
jgi:hypothetical protein